MSRIEQVEALIAQKDFVAAKRLCEELRAAGERDMRVDFLRGSIALLTHEFATARDIFSKLRKTHPNHSGVLNNLGAAILNSGGNVDTAQQLIERSLEIDPRNVPALVSLGDLYLQRKRRDDAIKIYERLIATAPEHPQGYYGLGMCAQSINDYSKAEEWLKQAEERAPLHPSVLASLLLATTQNRNHDNALRIAEKIIATPSLEKSLSSAWAVVKRYCQWDTADALLPRVLEQLLSPETPFEYFGPIALEILSSDKIDHDTLKRLHTKWGDGIRERGRGFAAIDRSRAWQPAPRMRIGYLSGDFRNHVASLFIRGVINHHDPSRFEVFLYSSAPVSAQDETTGKYFRVAEHFIHCQDMDDGELARRIAADGIHTLIDLSGFTQHTRMSVLALAPAPVQLTYIGYPATYGLREVDYIISHAKLTGTDHAAAFVEAPLELPRLYAVSPTTDVAKRPAALPCADTGRITFGSLINPYKINRSTIALWARVLRAVADSRIYLNHPIYACAATRSALQQAFAAEGIDADRITATDERPPGGGAHYLLYDHIDIVLDATPMTGGAGTSDALTVGVPVISRLGTVFHERLSASAILANTPEPDAFMGEDDDAFVNKAVALAGMPERLAALRDQIFRQVRFGPYSDTEQFTRDLEALYRDAWNRKFADQPIDQRCQWQLATEEITVAPYRFRFAALRNDLHRYVARELGSWFEPECAFLARHAGSFATIWDISDDPGLATIPVAAQLEAGQSLTALRLTRAGHQLMAENAGLNGVEARCRVIGGIDALTGAPLAIRLAAERNDGHAGLLAEVLARCDGPPLIVLVALEGPNGPDRSAADHLAEQGYQPFRLHTGCDVLVAASADDSEHTTRNLFYVLPAAVPALAEHGLLCIAPTSPHHVPAATETAWQRIATGPGEGGAAPDDSAWSDVFRSALNAYAYARDPQRPPAERVGWFALADQVMQQLIVAEPTIPRVFTAIRLAYEDGRHDAALTLARSLADELRDANGSAHGFGEPFVAPHATLDPLQPEGDLAAWSQSLALVAVERMRRWSSFFTAGQSTHLWNELARHPWMQAEAARMLALLGSLWEANPPAAEGETKRA